MEYTLTQGGHVYVYEIDYGEETQAARIIVNCDAGSGAGLFIVKANGQFEYGADLPGFTTNPLQQDGIWPSPPAEAIVDAQRIAQSKSLG